jgi:hypothetical protein
VVQSEADRKHDAARCISTRQEGLQIAGELDGVLEHQEVIALLG